MNFDRERWTAVLQTLVRIPSPFEHELAMTAQVEALLRDLGTAEVHRVPHCAARLERLPGAVRPFSSVQGRHSLVAYVRGSGGGRSLALNAHLDTAPEGEPAAWSRPPFSGDFEADTGRIYGRGAMDDKAGVVVLLAVLETLLQAPEKLRGDVVFHFVLEDEITGNGTLLCLDAGHRADAACIVDGTRLERAIREHAGQLAFSVELTGRPASVSVSHVGVNAAEAMARLALALREFILAMNDSRPDDWRIFPSPYQCSLQALHADGGAFTLPERATAKFYTTFCPPDSLASMHRKITAFVEGFAASHGLPSQPRILWNGFAAEPVSLLSDEIVRLLDAAGVSLGPSTGTSDLRHYAAAGIPAFLYGPGGGQNPHRADEFYPVADLENMVAFYLNLARTWCNGPA